MSSSKPQWVFLNRTNPNEIIYIHDQTSAQALKMVLQRAGGNWEIREEIGAQSLPPAAPPTKAPSTPRPRTGKTGMHKIPANAIPRTPENERRAQKRFETEFRVILISGSSSFRTVSQDISLGGMKLKKTVPANFLTNNCVAYISHKDMDENLEMVCTVIADPSDPRRVQFQKPDANQLNRLNEWLKAYSK